MKYLNNIKILCGHVKTIQDTGDAATIEHNGTMLGEVCLDCYENSCVSVLNINTKNNHNHYNSTLNEKDLIKYLKKLNKKPKLKDDGKTDFYAGGLGYYRWLENRFD
jgi:hypothetical protein